MVVLLWNHVFIYISFLILIHNFSLQNLLYQKFQDIIFYIKNKTYRRLYIKNLLIIYNFKLLYFFFFIYK